jgi:hypothetical protein
MRKFLVIFLLPLCFAACTGNSSESAAATTNKDSVTAPSAPLPYTATYSSDFLPGKATDVAVVLDNYKAWETNDMKAMRATYGDSVEIIFPSGTIISGTADSLIKLAAKYRDSLSKVELTLYAWTSNHSVDKNEDWVNVWYKEVDTYKTGKIDSVSYEDANRLKDGKIVWVSSHEQKFKKK